MLLPSGGLVSRLHCGSRGLVTATRRPQGQGVRGLASTACLVVKRQRRALHGSAAQFQYAQPPPPPPPPPPPHFDYYGSSASQGPGQQGPVIVQIKRTRGQTLLFLSLLVLPLLFLYYQFSTVVENDTGGVTGNSVKAVSLANFETMFSDVLGCDEAKEELEEIVMFLKDPTRFTRLGGKLPKGALLVGPPGTGKTMLAKAIAKEAGVPFFYMSGAEFDEMYVGVGSRRVRDLFEAAKKSAPSLIFIDEIDAIGSNRSASDQGRHRMTLNQLLSEMDGFLTSDEVIVIGATNTPKALDPALTRPGRLDKIITVDPPDVHGRAAILQLYLSKVQCAPNIDADVLARGLPGYAGAELRNIVNVAAIHAAMQDKDAVSTVDLEYAKDRISMGAAQKSKLIPPHDRKVTAWHEAGHALAALLTKAADPVHKATIVPRGNGILGLVLQHPDEDRYSMTRQMMYSRLVVALAGRAGEQELLGASDVTGGAASDFEAATSLARTMVRKYGMAEEELGVVDYGSSNENAGAYLSEETKEMIEKATRDLLDKAYAEALALVSNHRDKLSAIANALLVHETLSKEQLLLLRDGLPLPPLPAAQKPPHAQGPVSVAPTSVPGSGSKLPTPS